MDILILKTGLFPDADFICEQVDAPFVDLQALTTETQWDNVLEEILDCDLVITA